MTYKTETLDNGLRIASECHPDADSAAFAIAVDVGARYEEVAQGGLSHMLEHMAFKGTSKRSAQQIAEAFDLMGGNVNAYTSHEHTLYYAKVLKEYAGDALELLCEILADSVFDPQEIEREREVVLQEIAMHHDAPDDLVFDLFQQMAFGDTPMGRSILGDPERVRAYSRDDLLDYTRTHYQPSRIAIAGAGAIDHAALVSTVRQYFGKRKNETLAKPVAIARYVGGEKTLEKELEQVQLAVGFHGVSALHDDYYPSQVFTTLLGGGMSSRLFQEIREKRGLAYSVSAYSSGYNDIGVIGMYAGTTVEHLSELTGALKEVMASLLNGVGDEELLRAKNQIKANVLMSRESTGTIVEWIARHLLVYGRYRPAAELVPIIDAITPDDMARLANYCLDTTTPIVAALGPVGSVNHAGLAAQLAA